MKKDVLEVRISSGELLIGREAGEEVKEEIISKISELEPNTVLEVNFSFVKFIDASAANAIVVNVLGRLESGEFPDRFIVLSHVEDQHKDNMEYALKVAGKNVVVKEDEGWSILGELFTDFREALDKVMELGSATARELQEAMGYSKVNEASTRLSYLFQRGLIARESVSGRKFRYFSLIQRNE